MPTETYRLAEDMEGFSKEDLFTVKGRTATHVQLVPSRRPQSVVAITKEEFDAKFRIVTA